MCLGTIMSGHKLNVSGHNRVWAQSCMGTNMYGHKRGGTPIRQFSLI